MTAATQARAVAAALLALVIAVVSGGAGYEAIEMRMDRTRYPPPGKVVAAGDLRLHIYCTGPRTRDPTVVFEAGKGGFSLAWAAIQDTLSQTGRVCSYDRAGYGWSEFGNQPHDARETVRHLHLALAGAGESGPYVLVAHSLGGLFVRLYASEFPSDVAGLVLLDPSHEDQVARLPSSYLRERRDRSLGARAKPILATLGFYRLQQNPGDIKFLPEHARGPFYAKTVIPQWYEAQMAEEDVWDATDAEVRRTGPVGDIPLLVLTATVGESPDFLLARQKMQAEIAALSTCGEQRLLPHADHYSFFFDPAYVQTTIAAIREVIADAQNYLAERAAAAPVSCGLRDRAHRPTAGSMG